MDEEMRQKLHWIFIESSSIIDTAKEKLLNNKYNQ